MKHYYIIQINALTPAHYVCSFKNDISIEYHLYTDKREAFRFKWESDAEDWIKQQGTSFFSDYEIITTI